MNQERSWVYWWTTAWRQAHPDWTPTALAGVELSRLDALARSHHMELCRAFGILPCTPPPPHVALLEFISSNLARRELTLALVAATCDPQEDNQLSAEQRSWCLSVAKALRPRHWLSEAPDSLNLLRAWVGMAAWQRLRLSFPRPRIDALERHEPVCAPAGKLDALWQAALWRSAKTPANGHPEQEHADASPALG
ncbi:hypothetical protein ACX0MV_17145 [Pseudomonas borbori]